MEKDKLELDHTYLIQFGQSDTAASITVLIITEKAYRIRWNVDNKSTTWELKNFFHRNWNIIEDISDFVATENTKQGTPPAPIPTGTHIEYQTEFTQCYVCHGEGTIPDPKSTAGKTVCPYCLGAKMITKSLKRKTNL